MSEVERWGIVELLSPPGMRLFVALERRGPEPCGEHLLSLRRMTAEDANTETIATPDSALEIAARRILRLDSSAARDVVMGGRVVKVVPGQDPLPLPPLAPEAPIEEYWQARQPLGHLVRPLFLPAPQCSSLLDYQSVGVAWLLDREQGILADDMGLGKTLQAIMAMRVLFQRGHLEQALVVCPRSLLANWEAELERWAPELSRLRVVPGAQTRDAAWATMAERVHVIITNYEHMRQVPQTLRNRELHLVVADEAHRLRNADALTTRGIRRLRARRFWALTGTPIERDPRDLATLLSLLFPTEFAESDSKVPHGLLRSRARAFVLRRRKKDVLDQLPEVVESIEMLDLSPGQRGAYSSALDEARGAGDDSAFLRLIGRCRLICDYDPDSLESSKADRIAEVLDDIESMGEKAVVFSYLLKPLEIMGARLAGRYVRLVGEMSSVAREDALRRFKKDRSVPFLLASSRIAAEGLTLTEANHVVFFNEWWNPSANAQARDRVVRIGQLRGVRVYKFRCRRTIEELLERILAKKSEMFEEIVERMALPAGSSHEFHELASELRHLIGSDWERVPVAGEAPKPAAPG